MSLDLYPIEGPWAGKLAVCARPRPGTWIEDDVQRLKGAGYDILVSAITAKELAELHLGELADVCTRYAVEHVHFSIGNLQVPSIPHAMPRLHAWADALAMGRGVALHCFGSVGRSPTLAAALLVLRGIPADEAWDRVQAARGRDVPDTLEQRTWVAQLHGGTLDYAGMG